MVLPQVVRDSDRAAERSEEHRRGRFAHLLKPIRDLAENFSIDLAAELEDYLEELYPDRLLEELYPNLAVKPDPDEWTRLPAKGIVEEKIQY